jgi:hypothetical protein
MLLTLAGLITISAAVLSFGLMEVLSEVAVLKGGKQLREQNAVFFTAYYPPEGGVSQAGDNTIQYLMGLIDQRQAYTAIVYNMALQDPDFAGGHPTLLLFGDVVPELFPDMHLCDPAPCAALGAKVSGYVGESLNVGGLDIPVEHILPRGVTFFDVNAAGLPLDNRIIIRVPTQVIPHLNPIEQEELLTRAVLLDPPDSIVDTFVSGAAQGGLFLVPNEVSVEQPKRFREIMMGSVMYIVGMLAFLTLAFTAYVSSARLVMQQERREFKIRQMYGATPLHISLRIGGFLSAGVLIPQVALLFILQRFLLLSGAPAPDAPIWVAAFLVLIFAFLWHTLVQEVLAKEGLGGW